MIELYPEIRTAHIWAISLSGIVMALRYLGAVTGGRWQLHIVPRAIAWTVDGTVLTAAAMLLTILPKELYANGWLVTKLVFVVTYFALGYYGLAARHGRARHAVFGLGTALCFGAAYSIARAHDPLGWLA